MERRGQPDLIRGSGFHLYTSYITSYFHLVYSLLNCFGWFSVCFGSIETSKLSVSVQKRNNRNKRFVSDSAETSFGSSFGCFESKLVSKDTLIRWFYEHEKTQKKLDCGAQMGRGGGKVGSQRG